MSDVEVVEIEEVNKRPLSVSIISWFVIVTSVIAFIYTILSYGNPFIVQAMESNVMPVGVQYAIVFVNTIIGFICAVLMLKGMRIGRTIYIALNIVGLMVSIFTTPAILSILPSVVVFAIIAFFLFRAKTNNYFLNAAKQGKA